VERKKKKVQTTVYLEPEDYKFLKAMAQAMGLSFADTVRLAIRDIIKRAQAETSVKTIPPTARR
jgi:hypothetical protein